MVVMMLISTCFSAEKEDQEVMYADVRVMQQQGKSVDEGGEEVLYGQVKFS